MSHRLGLVIPLTAEARAVLAPPTRRSQRLEIIRLPLVGGGEFIAARSGPGPESAAEAARALAAGGATALVSTGVAGGLAPTLLPGDLVLATAVCQPDQSPLPCDETLQDRLAALLHPGHLSVCRGPLLASVDAVELPAAKNALHQRYQALAVDQESGAIAAVAADRALPFAALRAICDPADRALPSGLSACLDADGDPRLRPLAALLMRRPATIFDLIKLGTDFRTALRSLENAWQLILASGQFRQS